MSGPLVQVDFGQGLDQKTDSRHVAPGKLLEATNVRFNKNGALEKRLGSTYLTTVSGGCARLATRAGEVLTVAPAGALSAYSVAAAGLEARGQVAEATVTREGLYADSQSPSHGDIAYGNGVIVCVWMGGEDFTVGADIYISVIDATNGVNIVSARNLSGTGAAAVYPRVVYLSGSSSFAVLYAEAAGTSIHFATVSNSWGISAVSTLISNNVAGGDFGIGSLSDRFVVAHQSGAGTNPIVLSYGPTGTVIAGTVIVDAAATNKFGFGVQCVAGEAVWTSYCGTTGGTAYVKLSRKNTATLVEQAGFPVDVASSAVATFISSCPTRVTSTTTAIAISAINPSSVPFNHFISCPVWSTSGAQVGSASWDNRTTSWCAFASAAFVTSNGRAYAFLYTQLQSSSNPASTCVLVDVGATDTSTSILQVRPVTEGMTRIAASDNATLGVTYRRIPSVAQVATDQFQFVGRMLKSNAGREGLQLVTADFTHPNLYASAEIGGSTAMVPGVIYDGVRAFEMGFIQSAADIALTTPIGGTMAAGTYGIVVVPEYVDVNGNLHQGIPSIPQTTVAALNDKIQISIPAITLTRRQSYGGQSISWAVYMTAGIAGTTAGPFYRTSTVVANDVSSSLITAFVTTPDSSLSSNAQVYTAGGVLENVCPPSTTAMVTHKGRVWLVGDDLKTVWFSKAFVDGDGLSFSDAFTIPLEDGAVITALGSMDSTLVIFTRSRVYVLQGTEGPNDLGTGSDIVTPLRLAVDLGCIEPRSVVLTPMGLIFQSSAGLYLLSRGLEVSYIGQPVEDLLLANPTITSAVVHPSGSYVEFVAVGTTYGVRLIFDYRTQQWSSDTIGTIGAGSKLAGECVVDGSLYSALTSGALFRENTTATATAYLDQVTSGAATWITARVEVANIKLGGLQGFQRARHLHVLAEKLTSHGLLVEVANDYSATYHQTVAWPWQDLDTMPREQIRTHLAVQKCTAVRVRLTDSTPTGGTVGTGRGPSLKGLAFEIQQKPGATRLPAQAKA